MESKIYTDIQKQLFYMIPEKWVKIALYATVDRNMSGELFFYYIPKAITKEEPINCYEIPGLFDINESEYLNLLSSIYNKIKILKSLYIKEQNKDWTNLTIVIDDEAFRITYSYENLVEFPFDPYERHIIWRKEILDVLPVLGKDKKIIERYDKVKDSLKIPKEVRYEKREKLTSKNVVNFERVLTVDEAIAQTTKKKKIDKKSLTKEEKKIEKERQKQEKIYLKEQKKRDKERRKQERELLGKKGLGLFDKGHRNRLPDE